MAVCIALTSLIFRVEWRVWSQPRLRLFLLLLSAPLTHTARPKSNGHCRPDRTMCRYARVPSPVSPRSVLLNPRAPLFPSARLLVVKAEQPIQLAQLLTKPAHSIINQASDSRLRLDAG